MIGRLFSFFRRKGGDENEPLIDETIKVADASFGPLWLGLVKNRAVANEDQARFVLRTELVIFLFLFALSFMAVEDRKRKVINIGLKRIPRWLIETGFERVAPSHLVDDLSAKFSKLTTARFEYYRGINSDKSAGGSVVLRAQIDGFIEIIEHVVSIGLDKISKQVFIDVLAHAMLKSSLIALAGPQAQQNNQSSFSPEKPNLRADGVEVALEGVDAGMAAVGEGIDEDEFPEGSGKFGWEATNPVPCRGLQGSRSYLERLACNLGPDISFERVGSLSSRVSSYPVDAYLFTRSDGAQVGTLYISPYQRKNSARLPNIADSGSRKTESEVGPHTRSGVSYRPTRSRCPNCMQISRIPAGEAEFIKCSECGRLMAV